MLTSLLTQTRAMLPHPSDPHVTDLLGRLSLGLRYTHTGVFAEKPRDGRGVSLLHRDTLSNKVGLMMLQIDNTKTTAAPSGAARYGSAR